MMIENFNKRIKQLEIDCKTEYLRLINENESKEVNFLLSVSEYDDYDDNVTNIIENDIQEKLPVVMINTHNYYVISLDKDGMYCVEMSDATLPNWYKFGDISSLFEKTYLLSEMSEINS